MPGKTAEKIFFRANTVLTEIRSGLRKLTLRLQGMKIGDKVLLGNSLSCLWPHQVMIGSTTIVENNVSFKYDGAWAPGPSILIGADCFIGNGCEFNIKGSIQVHDHVLIGSGSRFIDHDHGIEPADFIKNQECPTLPIVVEEDVWIGANVVVLKGVRVGRGSVVAAGAVLTKSVPPYQIWGGVPAKQIGTRKQPNVE